MIDCCNWAVLSRCFRTDQGSRNRLRFPMIEHILPDAFLEITVGKGGHLSRGSGVADMTELIHRASS